MKGKYLQFLLPLSICLLASVTSYAADINITTSQTTTQTFTTDNQKMTIGAGGNISTTASAGISESSNTDIQVVVNTGDASKGVAENGNSASAISLSGTAATVNIHGIEILSGRVTSNATGSVGTISLSGSAAATSVYAATGTTITNTASDAAVAQTIHFDGGVGLNGSIVNEGGTISTNNNAGSVAISLTGSNGSLNVNNFSGGIISGPTAIFAATGINAITIVNDIGGTGGSAINGAIIIGADDIASEGIVAAVENEQASSSITGNITTNRASLAVTNSGTITGSINLGNNAESYLYNDGVIIGNITLGNAGQFLFGPGSIAGTIDGAGQVILSDNVINGNIGSATAVTSIEISGVVDAITNNNSIRASAINIDVSSTLVLGAGTLTAIVDGSTAGVGTLNLNANNTIALGTQLGSTNGLAAVNILNGVAITDNGSIKATTTTIGSGGATAASLNLAANQTISGNVAINTNSTLTLNNNSVVTGTINGVTGNAGTVIVNGSSSFGAIGQGNKIAEFDILSGTSSFNNNASISQIDVAGTLSLVNATAITGNITVNNGGAININSAAQTVSGNFTASSGSAITIGINSPTSAASLTAVGVATISANTVLHVNLGGNTTSAGSSYTIVSGGTGSLISQIAAANINVDNSGNNKSGSLIFTTAVSGDALILNVTNNSNPSFATNSNQLSAYNAINGANVATGALAVMQNYLNNNAISDSQKTAAIKSASPEADNSVNRISFNNASVTANIISERINLAQNIVTKYKLSTPVSGVASGDKPKTDNLWIQSFGSQVKQSSTAQGDGYNANSAGLALGADTKISKDTLVGFSLSYANSNVKSQTRL